MTVFKGVQQLKQMLGEISDSLDDIKEVDGSGRRLLEEKKCNIKEDVCGPAGACACDDRKFNCDCTPNYNFLSLQKLAGCDGLDSDGDDFIDVCEDLFPPSLLLKDSDIFRCDETDIDTLCYSEKTFSENQYAKQFLANQVQVTDDCQSPKNIGMDINLLSDQDSCGNTIYGEYFWLGLL